MASESLVQHWPLFGLRLATPRLRLTPLSDDDLPEVADLILGGIHDPERMPFGTPWTDAPRDELIANSFRFLWRSRSGISPTAWSLSFGVRRGAELVGVQSVDANDFAVLRSVDTGSWLGRSFQGQGIGTEMRYAVLDFAFDHLKATRATSGAFVDNPASLRVSEKLGYRPDGTTLMSRRGEAVVNQRLLVTPETLVRQTWRVQVAGLDPCRLLLGL